MCWRWSSSVMEMLWSTSWTNRRVCSAANMLLWFQFLCLRTFWLTLMSGFPCTTTTRCAEQQRDRSEDSDVEDPSWTTGQRGCGTRRGWKWTPGWTALHPSSRNRQHRRLACIRLVNSNIYQNHYYWNIFLSSSHFQCSLLGSTELNLDKYESTEHLHELVHYMKCFFDLSRRWGWNVQSGWSLNFHLSESQTGTQHGSDWWEALCFLHTHQYCSEVVD